MGATKIIAIDIVKGFRQKVDTSNIDILYLKPSKSKCFFLNLDNNVIKQTMELGYKDVMDKKDIIIEFINN